jgi:peptide/nickel transport system substrate-binding protein
MRQAMNYAINREDLVQYGARGNGVIIPALIPAQEFGHDPSLTPYPFDPVKAKELMRQSGYPNGLAVSLIASEVLAAQATVVSKMLEQSGLKVEFRILDPIAFQKKTLLSDLDQPAEKQTWDIALAAHLDQLNFPAYNLYQDFALDGPHGWAVEDPVLRQLYDQVLRTVDPEKQQTIYHQMERHTRDQAYFLFLYNPVQIYAVNKAVQFVPYVANLYFAPTSVTDEHWSVRKGAVKK